MTQPRLTQREFTMNNISQKKGTGYFFAVTKKRKQATFSVQKMTVTTHGLHSEKVACPLFYLQSMPASWIMKK
jgi:hypothetical protein